MSISHIVAMSENRVIGKDGSLPWRIPADLKFFKEKTSGHVVIMGRKTYESIGRPLPHRLNIVITRSEAFAASGTLRAASLDEALAVAQAHRDEYGDEVFIIGGGEIYRQSLPMVDRIYLTRVQTAIAGDTFYPEFDEQAFDRSKMQEGEDPVSYEMWVYQRRAPCGS